MSVAEALTAYRAAVRNAASAEAHGRHGDGLAEEYARRERAARRAVLAAAAAGKAAGE